MSLTPEQLEVRRRLVTASVLPILLGESPFKTLPELLWEKTDPKYVKREHHYQQRGHRLEQNVAEWAAEELGCTPGMLQRADSFFLTDPRLKDGVVCDDTVRHAKPNLAWAACTPDRIIKRPGSFIEVIECKTSSSRHGWRGQSVPRYIWIQCQWQMFVLRSWFQCDHINVAALVSSDYVLRKVDYDHQFIIDSWAAIGDYRKAIHHFLSTGTVSPRPIAPQIEVRIPEPGSPDAIALARYVEAADRKREAIAEFDEAKVTAAQIIHKLGGDAGALVDGKLLKLQRPNARLDQTAYITALEDLLTASDPNFDSVLARQNFTNQPDPEDLGWVKIGKRKG